MQELLMKEYNIDKRAYSELYAILQMLGKEYIDKIPEKIYKTIESRKDDTYNPIYNDMEEVLEGRVKRKTVSMLALLDYNYFSTSETDRMYMRYILEENENKYKKDKNEYKIVDIDEDQKKVNDNIKEAMNLVKLVNGRNIHINLIPVNPIKERDFKQSDKLKIKAFKDFLEKHKVNATVRREMGRDIDGACGQLRRRCIQSETNS